MSKAKENKTIKNEDSGIKKSDTKNNDDNNKNLSITKNLFKDISNNEKEKEERKKGRSY